jgi:hypothetical protein
MHSLKFAFILWALLHDDAGLLGQAYILKALTHEVKQ